MTDTACLQMIGGEEEKMEERKKEVGGEEEGRKGGRDESRGEEVDTKIE